MAPSWLDRFEGAKDWLVDVLEPDAAVGDDSRVHRRGSVLWSPRTSARGERLARMYERELLRWERRLARPGDHAGLRLWGPCGLRWWQETGHFLLLGATDAGKTTVLEQWLDWIIRRGDRVLVIDPKADLVTWLLDQYADRCAVLAPWDARSLAWRLGGQAGDVRTMLDCDDVAKTLFPDVPEARDQYWVEAPRAVVRGIMQHLTLRGGPWSFRDMWAVFARGPKGALDAIMQTPSGGMIGAILAGGKGGPRTSTLDVWSTLGARLTWLEYLRRAWPSNGTFAVRAWMAGGQQVLVVPVVRRYASLGSVVARLVIEELARTLLSLRDSQARRVWIFADEFSALGELPAAAEILLRARSKGGIVVAALQDLGSIEAAWGAKRASSILNAFATVLTLRIQDPGLQRWAAEVLGRREVVERMQSQSRHEHSTSHGQAEHVREEFVVMPSELRDLPTFSGYLRVVGWPAVQLSWSRIERPRGAEPLEPAAWLSAGAAPAQPSMRPDDDGDGVPPPPEPPTNVQDEPEEPPRRDDGFGL